MYADSIFEPEDRQNNQAMLLIRSNCHVALGRRLALRGWR